MEEKSRDSLNKFLGIFNKIDDNKKLSAYRIGAESFREIYLFNIFSTILIAFLIPHFSEKIIYLYMAINVLVPVIIIGAKLAFKLNKAGLTNRNKRQFSRFNIIMRSVLGGILYGAFMSLYYINIGKFSKEMIFSQQFFTNFFISTFLFGGIIYCIMTISCAKKYK
ncbi:hypothetical protein [Facklamia sp. 7083-14-GEN3]|uniref:hypothetical protein n=1 Tax=Facklamia sp. 7083-14-GEN3 TaxID=2973478 RepID=UPI00215C307B|nr:hypothetical protein [Facklamia sp. 7083-14-GEN3]MCR8969742.1 hypothetical protein [Facklamia sp. 7083-14-GEN3]